jgi:hypothetical protein
MGNGILKRPDGQPDLDRMRARAKRGWHACLFDGRDKPPVKEGLVLAVKDDASVLILNSKTGQTEMWRSGPVQYGYPDIDGPKGMAADWDWQSPEGTYHNG